MYACRMMRSTARVRVCLGLCSLVSACRGSRGWCLSRNGVYYLPRLALMEGWGERRRGRADLIWFIGWKGFASFTCIVLSPRTSPWCYLSIPRDEFFFFSLDSELGLYLISCVPLHGHTCLRRMIKNSFQRLQLFIVALVEYTDASHARIRPY